MTGRIATSRLRLQRIIWKWESVKAWETVETERVGESAGRSISIAP